MELSDVFMKELQECLNENQDRIRTASQLCNNAVSIQKARQKRLGYLVRYDISLREGAPSHEFNRFGDYKYDVSNIQKHIFLKKEFYKNGNCVYKYNEDNTLFMYVENLKAEAVDGSELINCPNCGAPTTLEAIRNGCPYCGTHFEMSEIYPVVTNYFTKFDVSMVEERKNMNNPIGILKTYGKAYAKFAKLLTSAPSAASMVAQGGLTSKKRFEEIMKQYIPDFSYLHFGDMAIDMLKLLLFSDNPSSLPFVAKDNCMVVAPNLIDFEFIGFGLDNKDVVVNGKYVIANVYIYVKSLYDTQNGVAKVQENFRATLSRDISKPVKMGFSYTKINCPSCGGVFDAYKTKSCPYCSTVFKLQDEEWFVLDISRG